MRNFIHINLCVSLILAQLTFVIGVAPHEGGEGVGPGCRTAAVIMHYLFLVSFMWMLMEGVVLYVALVRVFVKHQRRYMLASLSLAMVGSLSLAMVGSLSLAMVGSLSIAMVGSLSSYGGSLSLAMVGSLAVLKANIHYATFHETSCMQPVACN